MTLAPEHDLVNRIALLITKLKSIAMSNKAPIDRKEIECRMSRTSQVFLQVAMLFIPEWKKVPIWIGDYVLAGYGTGAVMSVPCGDQRDFEFAKHFDIPITNIFEG
ncbi:MAG: hypothetical protein CM15mP59_1200 [Flavobacteriaceae bacterium]|nr:MAG: hypothetical protein CM15mP59_1200 [Flavobacteriaceae bacterium]